MENKKDMSFQKFHLKIVLLLVILGLKTNFYSKNLYIINLKSGTTGDPKGAMISHENCLSCISSFL